MSKTSSEASEPQSHRELQSRIEKLEQEIDFIKEHGLSEEEQTGLLNGQSNLPSHKNSTSSTKTLYVLILLFGFLVILYTEWRLSNYQPLNDPESFELP